LESLLDEDEILQECKTSSNPKLSHFLNDKVVIERLMDLVIEGVGDGIKWKEEAPSRSSSKERRDDGRFRSWWSMNHTESPSGNSNAGGGHLKETKKDNDNINHDAQAHRQSKLSDGSETDKEANEAASRKRSR
jgi:hypothetical protein